MKERKVTARLERKIQRLEHRLENANKRIEKLTQQHREETALLSDRVDQAKRDRVDAERNAQKHEESRARMRRIYMLTCQAFGLPAWEEKAEENLEQIKFIASIVDVKEILEEKNDV